MNRRTFKPIRLHVKTYPHDGKTGKILKGKNCKTLSLLLELSPENLYTLRQALEADSPTCEEYLRDLGIKYRQHCSSFPREPKRPQVFSKIVILAFR